MPDATQIADLLAVPQTDRGLDWLKQALQTAARLEFATIPPYLCAMWSIKSGAGQAYDHLREVVMEEMLHLGLVCNMLTAIGGTPKLDPDAAPTYPAPLPGGVRPGLIVPLKGLTQDGIKDVFMEIEKPQHPISGVDPAGEMDSTIGDFYDAVLAVFKAPEVTITETRQLEWDIPVSGDGVAPLFKITSKADVEKAIGRIKEQGEGTTTSPTAPSPFDTSKQIPGDLAHYFRFAELYHEKKIVVGPNQEVTYTGADIPFSADDCYPMAEEPPGGYPVADGDTEVKGWLADFTTQYKAMLGYLQSAWAQDDGSAALGKSISSMRKMKTFARKLMAKPLPSGAGNYGPSFRIVGQG